MKTTGIKETKNVPTAPKQLPPYIVTKKEKLDTLLETGQLEEYHNMRSTIGQFNGYSAVLREASDVVEASVLALGVETAHSLISRMLTVQEGITRLQPAWERVEKFSQESNKMWEEVLDSVVGAYFSLKQRNESLERELQQLMKEQDSKEAALDQAAQYLHAVIAERAQWQAKHPPNASELPLEENFIEKTSAALDALYAIRNSSSSSNFASSQRLPLSKIQVSSVDTHETAANRWRSKEATRHALVTPSTRLHYIPPEEEVHLLRDTLAMGTGSTMLMSDIQKERRTLEEKRKEVLEQSLNGKTAIQRLRAELSDLKAFMVRQKELHSPFLLYKGDIMKLMQERIEEEVSAAVRARVERDPNIREMEGGYPWNHSSNTADMKVAEGSGTEQLTSYSESRTSPQEPPMSEEELEWRRMKAANGSLVSNAFAPEELLSSAMDANPVENFVFPNSRGQSLV